MGFRGLVIAVLLMCSIAAAGAAEVLQVGSKRFTESYVLGEILTATAATQTRAVHRQGLGNTAIVLEALKSGSIDVYPEYLGTIAQEILHLDGPASMERINHELAFMGLGVAVPLGFDNSYALAMRESDAARLGIRTLSELTSHPALRLGL
jgi:osmoprotectant transport system permease protein